MTCQEPITTKLNIKDISSETLTKVATEVSADCIITVIDKNAVEDYLVGLDVLKELDISEENDEEKEEFYSIQLFRDDKPAKEYDFKKKSNTNHFSGIIAEIVSDMIKKSYVKQGMKLLLVTDASVTKKYATSFIVLDVDRVLYRIGKFKLAEKMASETIIETVIDIGKEIGEEGREGKKVGTLFIIGDKDELEAYTRQLIMNPFKGYDKDVLHIVNNSHLRETIKNFAQLDGAFIIDNEGYIKSAGTYLDVDTSNVKPYMGWGTKHLAATAITEVSGAVAVLVSESGGHVKVFKNGKLILRIKQ